MAIYLIPIKTAMIFFPLLAGLFTLPYIITQYRKYGSILFVRTTIIYSFIFYLLCAYLLTMLPLPDPKTVADLTSPTMQLIPFQSLQDVIANSPLVLSDPSTYLPAINTPTFYILLFNFFLLLPLGIYLRYYFTYSWKKTLLITFLVSLSFECIQRSALFGIYPRPYRIFDVDDLITNTLGGMMGYLITPLVGHFLPSREALDESAYVKGTQVSFFRRALAFTIDILFLGLACWFIYSYDVIQHRTPDYVFLISSYYVSIACLFFFIPWITKGKTIGKFFVRMRILNRNGNTGKWYQYLIHYMSVYGLIFPLPFVIYGGIYQFLTLTKDIRIFYLLGSLIAGGFFIFALYQIVVSLFNPLKQPFYARLSHLQSISTVVTPQTDIEEPETPQNDENELATPETPPLEN